MTEATMKRVQLRDGASANIVQENVRRLQELFPEAFSEGVNGKQKINFDTLRQLLGDAKVLDEGEERYGLNWHGKKLARQIALTPPYGTLLPCPEESVDWDTTQNLFIEGDNLEVLKILQRSYANQVKMIYIDPPYNTGKEFIYPDKFQDNLDNYLKYTGQKDDDGLKRTSNTEASGRKHTNWLNMMYPRLKLAKDLLRNDGVIFISIDDNEQANLKKLCDEILGENNFVGDFIWKSKSGGANDSKHIAKDNEFILCFAKSIDSLAFQLDKNATVTTLYNYEDEKGRYSLDRLDKQSLGYVESLDYPITGTDGRIYVVEHVNPDVKIARWRWGKETVKEKYSELVFKNGYVYTKNYEKKGSIVRNLLMEDRFGRTRTGKTDFTSLFEAAYFSSPKPIKLIKYFAEVISNTGDIIFDFFAGSGTTAHAVMQLNAEDGGNRKCISVQLPELIDDAEKKKRDNAEAIKFLQSINRPVNIAEISKERIRRAAKKIKDENPDYAGDLGFKVFKLSTSNLKIWNPERKNMQRSLLDNQNHLVEGRSEQDVLYELLLKRGVDLTTPIESREIVGKKVHSIGYGKVITCLDELITNDEVESLAMGIIEWQSELKDMLGVKVLETHVFFKDSAFRDDIAKTNMVTILYQSGIKHVRSL